MAETRWEEILEPWSRLVTVRVLGRPFQVPENNLLLRGFQYLAPERVPYGDFCWNAQCFNCRCLLRRGGAETSVLACQTVAREGDELLEVSPEVEQVLRDVLRAPTP